MEITAKVIKVLPLEKGTSTKGEWQKQSVIIEYGDGQYPKKLELTAMKEKAIALGSLKAGQEVAFNFNVESREYNGRWFTSCTAWKWDVVGGSAPSSNTNNDLPPVVGNNLPPVTDNDLPF